MGSKTPNDHHQEQNGGAIGTVIICTNPSKPAAARGLFRVSPKGEAEDDDDGRDLHSVVEERLEGGAGAQEKVKKRKSRSKRKGKAKNGKKNDTPPHQSTPPRMSLDDLFLDQQYPAGEIAEQILCDNLHRTTAEEIRHLKILDDMDDDFLRDYRKAAETHRQVRKHVQDIARPGITMTELAREIEDGVRALVGHQGVEPGDGLRAGIGFPTGLCLNHVAAHWTPNAGNKEIVLQYDDVLKVDFGVHVSGRIVDSAFTIAFDPAYDPLLAAAKATTNAGLREAGVDARMDHLSETMQEIMESYEIELYGKTIPIKAVRNISGHNILRYKIHGDKQVPFCRTVTDQRMEEGDVFAIETFGTTGTARVMDDAGIYGYGRNENVSTAGLYHTSAKSLLKTIDANFGSLVFAKRYLERVGAENYHFGMRSLVQHGIVETYAPLVDIKGSYIAQFEHTVLLRPGCKEIVSRGDDY